MPDRDPAVDPIDKAYAEAEAMLSDEQTRAARRARVLAAVEGEAAATAPPPRRSVWRRGGWLAAASVAGLSALLTFHSRTPAPVPQPSPPAAAPAVVTRAPAPSPAPDAVSAPADQAMPQKPALPAPPAVIAVAPVQAEPAPLSQAIPPLPVPAAPPPPPPPMVAQPPEAPKEALVTAKRREADLEAETRSAPRVRTGAGAQADFGAPRASVRAMSPVAGTLRDEAGRLHAAAAAGRTAELEDLLAEGVPVDAPDAQGDTALMKSIQADQPAAAALLRRKGASLDRRNHAGASARDMAAARDDAELDRALDLGP